MQQLPGSFLRIVLFEVSEKGAVGEVLQARGVVGHDIGIPWEEASEMAVPVEPLVIAGDTA